MRKLFASALLALFTVLPISAGTFDQSMTMIRIMEQSDLEYKTELLENAFDRSDRIAGIYASEKLKTTMDGEFAGQSEEAVDAFKKVLIERLGETNSLEDADIIFTIFNGSDNSQLVRSAAEALGKIGAVQYTDNIIELLEDSNTKQYFLITQGYDNVLKENEKTAWSCVLALENLHSKECYEPLFHTRLSDYSKESGIKERASKAMTVIVRNPTSILKDISDREHSSRGRTLILDISRQSNALEVQKVDLAAYIFSETIVHDYEFGDYMINACAAIEKSPYKVRGTEAALKKILYGSYSPAFTDLAIKAAPHCQNGVNVLSDYLKEQNNYTREGATKYENHQIVLMVINSLGKSGDANAADHLIVARDAGWPPEIKQAADAALNNLLSK
ncbi:MAG: HEAT repeat domain-containing protein [Spirochaetia bacterium]|nr:HEAT repeat domain-containing protein [Spirochaetia bacterium]